MDASASAPHFPFGNALKVELYFCEKTFVFRAQTLVSLICQPKKEKRMPQHKTLLTNAFVKSVGRF